MSGNKNAKYRAQVVLRAPLHFDPQYIDVPFIDERIEHLKLESVPKHGDGPAIFATFMLYAPKQDAGALVLVEALGSSLAGYLGLIYEVEVRLESVTLIELKTRRMIQQQEGSWMRGMRKANGINEFPVFDKKEERALYWVSKGFEMVRPDDKLSCYYAAAEALVSSALKKAGQSAVCETCGRPQASAPIRQFLVDECGLAPNQVSLIINYRGDIVHGKRSAITHYGQFTRAGDDLLTGLRSWFNRNHSIPHYPPVLQVGGKFMFSGSATEDDLTNY